MYIVKLDAVSSATFYDNKICVRQVSEAAGSSVQIQALLKVWRFKVLLLITFQPISFKCGLSGGKRKTAQPFNCIQRARALQCAWIPSWTLPSTAATEPGATWGGEQEFKGEAKCTALLMAEKVIFYQSISNDDKTPEGASMLYYCLIQTNLGTHIERGWK